LFSRHYRAHRDILAPVLTDRPPRRLSRMVAGHISRKAIINAREEALTIPWYAHPQTDK
jgi:hypothetical protein